MWKRWKEGIEDGLWWLDDITCCNEIYAVWQMYNTLSALRLNSAQISATVTDPKCIEACAQYQ